MPKIQTYERQVSAPGVAIRSSAPDNAGVVGQAIEGFGQAVGQAQDRIYRGNVQKEINQGYRDISTIRNQFTQRIEDDTKAGTIDTEKISTDYQDAINKVSGNFTTPEAKDYFEKHSLDLQGDILKSATVSQAHVTGQKAIEDWQTSINLNGNTLQKDPSSFQNILDSNNQTIDESFKNGQIDSVTAQKLKRMSGQELAKSAVQGWADVNPDIAKQKLKAGEFDQHLDQDAKHQLEGQIEQAIRGKEIDQERTERLQEKALKKAQTTTQNDFLQQMEAGSLDSKQILNSNLDPVGGGSKEQFLQMLKKHNDPEEKLKTDGQTMINLYGRIHLPDGDPKKLTDENELNQYFGHGLSFADMNRLRAEMQGKETEAGKIESDLKKQVIDIAKGKLTKSNPLTGIRDPIGDEQMARFMVHFFDDYKKQRDSGKTATELLNPDSKDYLGKNISSYVRSPQQVLQDLVPKSQTLPSGKVKVSNGKETLIINSGDLEAAKKDGYSESK